MARILPFIIFFTLFFAIYSLMHLYVYTRVSKVYHTPYMWLAFIILGISFPAFSVLERYGIDSITRVFYFVSATWFGMVFLLAVGFLALDILSITGRINYKIGGIAVLVVLLLITIFSVFNAQYVRVKQVEIPLKNIEKNVTVVQLSDIHVGTVRNEEFLKKLVDKTNAINPDIVVITGDLFDGTGKTSEKLTAPLKQLRAPSYFVTGNHENYLGKDTSINLVKEASVTVLSGEVTKVKGVQLIGLDFPEDDFDRNTDKLKGLKINRSIPSVLLYHQPVLIQGVDVQLSGHTHNGQIWPFNFLVRLFFKYTYGLHKEDGTYIYVTSGAGTWGPPMRFIANPEIVVIKLRPA